MPTSFGDPDPSLKVLRGLNNACKIKFQHKLLAKIKFFKSEDNVPAGKLKKGVGSGVGSESVIQRY
jgi:hypothetical protein